MRSALSGLLGPCLGLLLGAGAPWGCARYGALEAPGDSGFPADALDAADLDDHGDPGLDGDAVDGADGGILPGPLSNLDLDHWRRYGLLRLRADRECLGAFARALAPSPEAGLPFWEPGLLGLWLTTDPGVGVDLAALAACEAAAADGRCAGADDLWCAAPQNVFRGRTSRGGTCTLAMACQSGLCSVDPYSGLNVSAGCGRCLEEEDLRAAGEPCAGVEVCQPGLLCRGEPARCVSGLAGEPCASYTDCQDGLFCPAGTCVPRGGEGAACAGFLDCAADLACLAGRCTVPVGEGAACPTGLECQPDLWCSDLRVCVSDLEAGEHCWASYACLPALYCDPASSTCVAALADGAACQWDPYGNWCQEESLCAVPELVCAPRSPPPAEAGDPCVGVECPYEERGLTCAGQGLEARCALASLVGLGAECDSGYIIPQLRLCDPKVAICDRPPGGESWTCQPLAALGQACGPGCRPPSVCGEATGTCRPLPRAGEACLTFELFSLCDFGFTCDEGSRCRAWEDLAPRCP